MINSHYETSCKFRNSVLASPSKDHVRGYVFRAAAARIKGRRHVRAVVVEIPLSRFIVRQRTIHSSPRTHECTHARHERQLPYYAFACTYTVASHHHCDKRRRFAPVSETARIEYCSKKHQEVRMLSMPFRENLLTSHHIRFLSFLAR